jgi:hypothetical protein
MFKGTTRLAKGAALVASLLALIVAAGAAANNGNKNQPSTSSIALAAPVGAATTSGWPSYGDTVRFNISTTATAYPYVNLNCYQNGNLVAVGWAGYFGGALGTDDFGLYSPMWTGGAASCTANLDMYASKGWKVLATTSFDVSA